MIADEKKEKSYEKPADRQTESSPHNENRIVWGTPEAWNRCVLRVGDQPEAVEVREEKAKWLEEMTASAGAACA